MALRSILCSQTLGWPMVGHRPGPSEPGCEAPHSTIRTSTGYPQLTWSFPVHWTVKGKLPYTQNLNNWWPS